MSFDLGMLCTQRTSVCYALHAAHQYLPSTFAKSVAEIGSLPTGELIRLCVKSQLAFCCYVA